MPSVVWNYFAKTEAGPKCLLCSDLRRRRDSSTKTMWVHLKLKHFDVYQALRGQSDRNTARFGMDTAMTKPSSSLSTPSPDNSKSNISSNPPLLPFAPFFEQQAVPVNNVVLQSYIQLIKVFNASRQFSAIQNNQTDHEPEEEEKKPDIKNIQNRYDLVSHWPERSHQACCVGCKNDTGISCNKCNVGLCVDCFKTFHLPS
ncbi:unnamed protein product [Bursaphelenchus xylophilus]|uniref:(pine wood nematode) hypothetical protein n=1 Tax=Bursaphelenchus xylophilus TaxID=6326 RepID=A0A7I8WWC9_BURXY|nr:unnamed protein product [Bursaphelenchus xylophilus]CAG9098343.1 unnamed protein product [Bursaphelenchus xylophilus]